MDFEASKRATVQIHSAMNASVVGTGFLVGAGDSAYGGNRYILTCAHVVKAALGEVKTVLASELLVTFAFALPGKPQKARVVAYEYCELTDPDPTKQASDFAVLYLSQALSVAIAPMPLAPWLEAKTSMVQSLGFPRRQDDMGRNLKAMLRGAVSGGWVQLQGEGTDVAVEHGFSGAPVWSEELGACVGMIVAREASKRSEDKMGFMIPYEKLRSPLSVLRWHPLLQILQSHQNNIAAQIEVAYRACLPKHGWSAPEQDLREQVIHLSGLAAGDIAELRLVQFAACLHEQAGVDCVRRALWEWLRSHANDLDELISKVRALLETAVPKAEAEPCLLVSVQRNMSVKGERYQVNAWFLADPSAYRYDTGEGAEALSPVAHEQYLDVGESIDLAGVPYSQIAVLVADYLDQLGRKGVDQQRLTVEFFLPLELMGRALERCAIPEQGGFGEPMPLGIMANCAHVLVRSQDRLNLTRYRPRWQTKWALLTELANSKAEAAFVDGDLHGATLKDKLLPNQAFGLSMSAPPKLSKKGEIALLLTTGTPAAVWLRCQTADDSLCGCLRAKLLSGNLADVPQIVWALRQQTPELENPETLEHSMELGHHLAFMWENPQRIPPEIDYSQSTAL